MHKKHMEFAMEIIEIRHICPSVMAWRTTPRRAPFLGRHRRQGALARGHIDLLLAAGNMHHPVCRAQGLLPSACMAFSEREATARLSTSMREYEGDIRRASQNTTITVIGRHAWHSTEHESPAQLSASMCWCEGDIWRAARNKAGSEEE